MTQHNLKDYLRDWRLLAWEAAGVPSTSTADETWNTCPDCGQLWKDPISTPGLVHRTRLCVLCQAPK
jgi:hypothetical protein